MQRKGGKLPKSWWNMLIQTIGKSTLFPPLQLTIFTWYNHICFTRNWNTLLSMRHWSKDRGLCRLKEKTVGVFTPVIQWLLIQERRGIRHPKVEYWAGVLFVISVASKSLAYATNSAPTHSWMWILVSIAVPVIVLKKSMQSAVARSTILVLNNSGYQIATTSSAHRVQQTFLLLVKFYPLNSMIKVAVLHQAQELALEKILHHRH